MDIGNKKVIEYIFEKIENVEIIDEIFIVTNAKFYFKFINWSKNYISSKKIEIINDGTFSNEDRLGAIGDIEYVVKNKEINDDLLVIAGDNLFEFSLNNFVDFFKLSSNSVIALCDLKDKNEIKNKFGCIELNSSKVIGFEEKPEFPKSSLAAIACYIYSKKHVLDLFKDNLNLNFENIENIMKNFIDKKELNGYVFSEKWLDIGSFNQLEEARRRYS